MAWVDQVGIIDMFIIDKYDNMSWYMDTDFKCIRVSGKLSVDVDRRSHFSYLPPGQSNRTMAKRPVLASYNQVPSAHKIYLIIYIECF